MGSPFFVEGLSGIYDWVGGGIGDVVRFRDPGMNLIVAGTLTVNNLTMTGDPTFNGGLTVSGGPITLTAPNGGPNHPGVGMTFTTGNAGGGGGPAQPGGDYIVNLGAGAGTARNGALIVGGGAVEITGSSTFISDVAGLFVLSTFTSSQVQGFGIISNPSFALAIGGNAVGISSGPTITGTADATGTLAAVQGEFGASGGTIATAYNFQSVAPIISGGAVITNLYGFFSNPLIAGTSNYGIFLNANGVATQTATALNYGLAMNIPVGGGNTSGNNYNYGIQIQGAGGIAGNGGTVNNRAFYVQVPNPIQGAGATASNYGLLLTGNGGSGGTTFNYAIYCDSTAQSVFAGSFSLGTVSSPGTTILNLVGSPVSGGAQLLSATPGTHTAVTSEVIDYAFTAHTMTITGGYTTQRFVNFAAPTISAATPLTVTNAATVTIGGSPVLTGAGPAAVTNNYALWVQGGTTELDGTLVIKGTSTIIATQGIATSGDRVGLSWTAGAHTGQTIAEQTDLLWNLQRTVTFTSGGGTIASQRAVKFVSPTYAASTNLVTITNAATVSIGGAPGTGANIAYTNGPWALWVESGNTALVGPVAIGSATTPTATSLTLAANWSIQGAGALTINTVSTLAMTTVGASSWSNSTGTLTLTTTTSGNIALTSIAAISLSAATASTWATNGTFLWQNTSGNMTIQTITSGTLNLISVGAINLTGNAASSIACNTGGLTISSTTSGMTIQTITAGTLNLNSAGTGLVSISGNGGVSVTAPANIGITATGGGAIQLTGTMGFFGNTGTAKPTVTGSKVANAALTSLMAALSGFGLVTDSTT